MHLSDILNAINAWAQSIIQSLGYPGLGLVMFLENVFPPIPSEIVLPLAGWLTLGENAPFTLLGVTLVGAVGSVAGAFFFYGLGIWFDESRVRYLLRRFGKWFMLSEGDFDVALEWFGRYDEYVIFFGRMVPIVRSLISVPAGLARMNITRFSIYTAVGTALWSFVLAFAGRLLGESWHLVSDFIDTYENFVIIAVVIAGVGFFGFRFWQMRKSAGKQESVASN
ncbi:MAG: DedA family protein [Anaerolineae bacterium]|nr:DedA family protein [Anaerolineae bacterium]